jgi:hypothetical protein
MLFPKSFSWGFLTLLSLTTAFVTAPPARAQAPLTIEGASDRTVSNLVAWFRVPTSPGYSYQVLLDGNPVPTDLTNWVTSVDYHEVTVTRTNITDGTVTNRLVRFIIQSERGDPEKGLIRWTPYPPIPSTAAELAGAQMRIITPEEYPLGLPIPMVVWLEDAQGNARRANGFVTAPGFEANPIQLFRGAGSGILPPATASGPLAYNATLPGLQLYKQVNIESTTSWTPRFGVLSASEVWQPNSRIHLTAGLTVPAGLSLTVGAGTIVKLNPLVNITNQGTVLINGTVDQPVVFTATNIVWPERNAGAWGGFVMRGTPTSRPVLDVNGAIFTGGGGGTGWSFPDPSTSHKSQQPVILMSNAVAHLTNSAIIHTAGQVHNGYNPDLIYDHTLCQKAITCGECVGGTVTVNHSAVIEFPNDDGVVDGTIADADYDGMYFTTGTHILKDSLFGFAKDDALDSGSGGAGTMWVSNCWVESALHEAHAWSGEGRVASSYDSVLINSGQGLEAGWTQTVPDGSPNVFAERLLTTANSVGARFGDNYTSIGSGFNGFLRLTNSLDLYNYRDIFLKTWNNPGSGWQTNSWVDRLQQIDIRSNYLTAADARVPSNHVWNPATDGWRLAHWMSTPPGAAVGIGFAVRTNQFAMTNLFDGLPIRLSTFTTNPVTANYAFESGGTTLATGAVTFAPGETLKRIYAAGFDLTAQSSLQVVLRSAVSGELTGRTNVSFLGSVPAPRVSCWVSTNTLPGERLPEGMLVRLTTPSAQPVSVQFDYVAEPGTLARGALVFAPGETVKWIDPTGASPAAYPLIQLSLSSPVGATLSGITTVNFGTPPLQVSLGVGSSQLDLATFSSGVPVGLNRASTNVVSVDFTVEASGGGLTNGTLFFSPGQAARLLTVPTVNPAQHDLLRVSLANAVNAQLAPPSSVMYVRVVAGPSPFLVTSGSAWRYLDTGGDAGTTWRQLAYNDNSWSNGVAQLGFGDGDEITPIRRNGTNGQQTITYYFRRTFVVENPAVFTNLALWLLRDDGGVVYLNNQDVWRSSNLPPSPTTITYQTLADYAGAGTAENAVDNVNVNPTRLVAGTNIVAVEIHQHDATSSDASFDFSLTGQPTPPPPPQELYWGTFSGQGLLAWGDPTFSLQWSDKVTGPWTNLVGALSPFYVTPTSGNAFFRLKR